MLTHFSDFHCIVDHNYVNQFSSMWVCWIIQRVSIYCVESVTYFSIYIIYHVCEIKMKKGKPMAMLNNTIINHSHLFTIHILILFLLFGSYTTSAAENGSSEGPSTIPIGVVLDTNSPMGSMVDLCMKMAVEDFYKKHPNYATRLKLHTRNANTILDANFAGMSL